jgi:serine/threonine-protein kinase
VGEKTIDSPSIDAPVRPRKEKRDTAARAPTGWPAVPGYEILAELGRGGMGVVYKARQTGLDRLVALKMVLGGARAGSADLARFRAEAQAIAQLRHPHIVQVYEVGEFEGQPFFSLEFMEGGSLADQLQGTPQPARSAAELVEALARAMHVAHERGIIHRDLKPANVLVSAGVGAGAATTLPADRTSPAANAATPTGKPKPITRGPLTTHHSPLANQYKITDFGLAKRLDQADALTQTGAVLGTPSYMAPEQAWGKNQQIGPAADVYALGAILYELLTGRPPFRAETALDTMLQVASQEPVSPGRLQPKVPRDLEVICLKCLEKDQRKRYPSAAALADDLHRFLNHLPILARPGGRLGRALKWVRRRPTAAALLGAGVLAVIGALVGITYHSVQLGRALKDTEQARADAEASAEHARQEKKAKELQRQAAETQRQKAEANFRRARAAVDQMLTRVAEEELAYLPHMEKLREAVLSDALRFYEEFLQEKSDDPVVRQEAGRAYRRVGDIYFLLNWYEPAKKAYGQALALQDKLVAEFPAEPAYRAEQATTHLAQGTLLAAIGELEEAEDAYRKARDIRERLTADKPEVPAYQLDLAIACNALGNLLRETGRTDEAAECYTAALERCTALPRTPNYRKELAHCYHLLGNMTRDLSQPVKTEANFAKAIELYEGLRKEFPADPEYRLELARVHIDLALVLRPNLKPIPVGERDRADRSEKEFQTAIALCQQLGSDFPGMPRYRLELSHALVNLGTLYRRRENTVDSDKAYRQALDITEKLVAEYQGVPRYQLELVRSQVAVAVQLRDSDHPAEAQKYFDRALTLARELVATFASVPEYKNELANTIGQQAMLLRNTGKYTDAVQRFKEAIEVSRAALEPNRLQPMFRRVFRNNHIDLADTYIRMADYSAAAATAELIPPIFGRDERGYLRATRLLARCAALSGKDTKPASQDASRRYADRAMEMLTKAVALKFRDADLLKRAADFRALRSRDDFKKLVSDLEKKK